MSELGKGILTFHKILRGCLAGEDDGWRGLLQQYVPLVLHLGKHYFGEVAADAEAFAGDLFARAQEQDAAALKQFAGATEEEFLMYLRALAMAHGRALEEKAGPPRDARPHCTVGLLSRAIEPLLYLQRQFVFLGLKGYRAAEIGEIMKVQPDLIAAALEKARGALAPHVAAGHAEVYLTRQDTLLREIEQTRTGDCPPTRTFVRIYDGQITWRDKEAAERHIHACHYCLDSFASFYEMKHYFHVLPSPEDAQIQRLASRLGLAATAHRKPGPLARLMNSLRGARASK